jgi:acetolactate synthase-1/2/3 large subunit
VSNHCEQLTDPDALGETLRRAFSAARSGRQRPAVVDFLLDVFDKEVDDVGYESVTAERTVPDPASVSEAVDVLLDAERPLIYAGQGVHYAKAWDELQELAELVEAPVATSLNGKSAFEETHSLSVGAGSKSEPKQLTHFLHEADVIFGIGCSFTTTSYGISVPDDITVIHSTLDTTDIDKDVKADHAVVGDAKLTLTRTVEAVEERLDDDRGRYDDVVAEIESIREEWLEDW